MEVTFSAAMAELASRSINYLVDRYQRHTKKILNIPWFLMNNKKFLHITWLIATLGLEGTT
jgi:hypothetical protein